MNSNLKEGKELGVESTPTFIIEGYIVRGADIGRIVIGVLVDVNDMKSWHHFLDEIGYKNTEETDNSAYKMFLGAKPAESR